MNWSWVQQGVNSNDVGLPQKTGITALVSIRLLHSSIFSNSPLIFSQLAVNTHTLISYIQYVYFNTVLPEPRFPSEICCIEIHQGSFSTHIMVKSSRGTEWCVDDGAERIIWREKHQQRWFHQHCIEMRCHLGERENDECVCVCIHQKLNPQSHSVCRRGKYIWGSLQEDIFSCHCSHQARHCLLQHSWASGVSLEQLQTGEPPAKVRMELLIKVTLTQPSIFWLDGLLWPKQCPSAFPLWCEQNLSFTNAYAWC